MATQAASINRSSYGSADGAVVIVQWAPLANGDVGAWVQLPEWADRTVHIYGTFGAGGTIVIQGSNETGFPPAPANPITLTDQNGVAMSYTAAALKQMTEAPLQVRPSCTAGDGTTSLNVILVMRRLQQQIN
jgi:hypothetical protein